ncbi:MAG TPA: Maf family nucleotide pyrophosphatase [Candidatus Cryosericum sp.]
MKLYLASSSPRRAHMLVDWGIPFSIVKTDVDEVMLDAAPENCAAQNALAKAKSGSNHVDAGLVIGVDTVVACDGRILGKPLDEAQARDMLALLEGREHRVITAMAAVLMPEKTVAARISMTSVFMRRLSEHERKAYLSNPEYRDKAGAYAVQGLAASFIERTDGPMDTIIGFTMSDFYALCTELHVDMRR